MSEWKPIGKAKKDGTVYLVYRPKDKSVWLAYFSKEPSVMMPAKTWISIPGCISDSHNPPTHFMPLPEPPKD